jgi:preprotein translocase subunit SecA
MRIFASDKMAAMMQRLGWEEGEAIEHRWVTKAIENAQRKVEGRNFDIRKQLLEYDDVANDQRRVIYEQRNELMSTDDVSGIIAGFREDVVTDMFNDYIPHQSVEEMWDVAGLEKRLENDYLLKLPLTQWLEQDDALHEDILRQKIIDAITEEYTKKENQIGPETMRYFEKQVLLQNLDSQWKEHLASMDHLRQGIHLRSYAQKNPKQEYKREAFELFSEMLDSLKSEVIMLVSKVQLKREEDVEVLEEQRRAAAEAEMNFQHDAAQAMDGSSEETAQQEEHNPYVRSDKKVGRNEVCPCGSGKKFKHCHGKLK